MTAYIDELLGKFGMGDSRPVGTPIVSRLSNADRGNDLSKEDHAQYRVIVGSLLYLSCWTRLDISFAVSELSRFVADPEPGYPYEGSKESFEIPQGYTGFGITVYSF